VKETSSNNGSVVSILPAIFWRQQINWSYSAGSRKFGLVACRKIKKKVTLSRKRCPAGGVWLGVMAAMLMVFGLTLTLPTFVLFFFFAFF